MVETTQLALIALGANVTSLSRSLKETVEMAMDRLPLEGESIQAKSRLFKTPCFPKDAGPDYLNAAVALKTTRSGPQLMADLHAIESDFGRERKLRWGNRTLDLDLLALGGCVIPDEHTFAAWANMPLSDQMKKQPGQLILPHPRMHERAFVLVPLSEVAPNWVHPVLGRTVTQMKEALDSADRDAIRAL